MPSARSSNSKSKGSRPFTTSTSASTPPTAHPTSLGYDESITKEPNSEPSIQSPKTLQTIIDHNNSRENPLDFLDKASSVAEQSGADEEAAESVSDFSDYPASSTRGIKSPYFGRRGGRLQTPPTTESLSAEFGDDEISREGSESTDGSITFSQIYRRGGEASRQGDWNQGVPIEDSPTIGRHLTASMRGLKSSTIDPQGRQFSISTGDEKSPGSPESPHFQRFPNSPNPTVSSIATTSTTARAERGLHIPFLPQFLKVLGSPRESEASPKYYEPEAVKEEGNKSVFEDESSDEDVEEIIKIHEARLGIVGRPVLVHQGSSTVVGLKDMLHSGPVPSIIHHPPSQHAGPSTAKVARVLGHEVTMRPGPISSVAQPLSIPRQRSTPGPSTAKSAQILGHEVQVRDGITEPREHQALIVEITAAPVEAKENAYGKGSPNSDREITVAWDNDDGLGSWRNPVSNLADGLRSNPVLATAKVHRSATVPSRRKHEAAIPQARLPPLASTPSTMPPPPPPPPSQSQLDKPVITDQDQDHYIQVVEERLQMTMEELARLKVELGSLKETMDGAKSPQRSKSGRFFKGLFGRK